MKTRDFNFAAYLIAHDEQLAGTSFGESTWTWFEFVDSAKIVALSNDYFVGEASVNAQKFIYGRKKLKNLLSRKVYCDLR